MTQSNAVKNPRAGGIVSASPVKSINSSISEIPAHGRYRNQTEIHAQATAHRVPDGSVSSLERPLTIAEVAGHYRVSERTVRRRIKDGTLHKELGQGRLVRISVEQLRRLAEKPY